MVDAVIVNAIRVLIIVFSDSLDNIGSTYLARHPCNDERVRVCLDRCPLDYSARNIKDMNYSNLAMAKVIREVLPPNKTFRLKSPWFVGLRLSYPATSLCWVDSDVSPFLFLLITVSNELDRR